MPSRRQGTSVALRSIHLALSKLRAPSSSNQSRVMDGRRQRGGGARRAAGAQARRSLSRQQSEKSNLPHLKTSHYSASPSLNIEINRCKYV